jgi:hypothetical protein
MEATQSARAQLDARELLVIPVRRRLNLIDARRLDQTRVTVNDEPKVRSCPGMLRSSMVRISSSSARPDTAPFYCLRGVVFRDDCF